MSDWTDIDFKPDADFVKAAAAYERTPLTDDIARGNHVVPTEFAQELERRLMEQCKLLAMSADREEKLLQQVTSLKSQILDLQSP